MRFGAMPKLEKQQLKKMLIDLGVYKPVRRFYDRIRPSQVSEKRGSMKLFSRFVQPGNLCFDVGANIGKKTDALLALGARVVAVEPQPSCQRELTAMFGGHPRFTLVPKGVGSALGTEKMHVSSQRGPSSFKADWFPHWDAEIDIEMTTLDAIIEVHGVPRFIKMDIEGFELEALRGLTQRVEFLMLEYNRSYLDQTFACIDYLERFGALRINFAKMEGFEMMSDEWLNHGDFLSRFHAAKESDPDHYWGDVYIQVSPPAA
jgi:FkbM family methyltransferase